MAELVDALDSKSSSFGSAGSIPAPGTFLNYEVALHQIFTVILNNALRGAHCLSLCAICDSIHNGL